MIFKLRPYQENISDRAKDILLKLRIVYLACEVRTGKTFMALSTAMKLNCKHVLFVTKKKAINSVVSDHETSGYLFKMTCINYESLHKLDDSTKYDMIITDESHCLGAFPKPSKKAKNLKLIFKKNKTSYHILLSGTMHPESYSQIYHQLWINDYSPFSQYNNFYKWAAEYVNVTKKYVGQHMINDYSKAYESKVKSEIEKIIISFTQEEAGFTTSVNENILEVQMEDRTYKMCAKLRKEKVLVGSSGDIVADSGAKLMQKLHQMYSGTVKLEDGTAIIFDQSKAKFIRDKFKNHKIAIFYKFVAELEMIKKVFKSSVTTDLDEFNDSDKNIALQIVSGREGISLSKAKYLIFINIDYSAVSYFQARDRLTTKERKKNDIYWIFSKKGIEKNIYKSVQNKKNYTLSVFKRDERAGYTIKN